MKSMTGYGWSEFQNEKLHLLTEIKSYNNKYLDLNINIPPFLNRLDTELRKLLKEKISRGRVELTIRVKELEEDLEVVVDKSAVKAYKEALLTLAHTAGLEELPNIASFLNLEGVMKTLKIRDIGMYKNLIITELQSALTEYDKARIREGAETLKDILSNLEVLKRVLETIKQNEKKLEEILKNNIITRYKEMIKDEPDEHKVLAEAAMLLMKYGIAEEINRLESHFMQFSQIAKEKKPVAKKLDFLCQEIQREINTIGSKNILLEISQAVVYAKDSLEKIREQLRNVE